MREGQLMDIERMREFIVFARTLNFTEAARELHMTQPSLSKHVRDMERDVGVTLVHRGTLTAPNTLTIAGERFADYARQATVAYDDIVEECRRVDAADLPMRIQDVRHVVNVVSNIRGLSSPEAEKAMSYQYVTGTGTLEKMLDDDLVDIAVSLEPTADGAALRVMLSADTYGIIALEPEPLFVLVGTESPYFGRTAITLDELAECWAMHGEGPFFGHARDSIAAVFAERGCDLRFRAHTDRPFCGGAYPLGHRDANICTRRFARYYRDLDAEDFSILEVEGFSPVLYPFVVFRHDNDHPGVAALTAAARTAGVLS